VGTAVLAAALFIGATSAVEAYRRSLPNPVVADAASLDRGRTVYGEFCITCHGLRGRGDGPLAATLQPRPADFRAHMAAGHTDAELFNWITNGVDGTAMPGFGGTLTENQRWDVLNYLRTFAAPQALGEPRDPLSLTIDRKGGNQVVAHVDVVDRPIESPS
jgi:mono/diheme cytochrome c family protein